jgi:hypothetical protein
VEEELIGLLFELDDMLYGAGSESDSQFAEPLGRVMKLRSSMSDCVRVDGSPCKRYEGKGMDEEGKHCYNLDKELPNIVLVADDCDYFDVREPRHRDECLGNLDKELPNIVLVADDCGYFDVREPRHRDECLGVWEEEDISTFAQEPC